MLPSAHRVDVHPIDIGIDPHADLITIYDTPEQHGWSSSQRGFQGVNILVFQNKKRIERLVDLRSCSCVCKIEGWLQNIQTRGMSDKSDSALGDAVSAVMTDNASR